MKLLIASTHLPPERAGAERIAWEIATRLPENWDVHMLTTTRVKSKAVVIHTIKKFPIPTLCHSIFGWGKIKALLEKEKFNLIHSHMALPWGFLLRNSKAKKIITLHGEEAYQKSRIHRLLRIEAFKRSQAVTVPSLWLKRIMQKEYGLRCIHIPNSTDTETFRVHSNVKRLENVVLYVGRLTAEKGVMELIKAAKLLSKYRFYLAGDGPLFKTCNLPNLVRLGRLDDSELVKAYNSAQFCVFPSHKENFPLVGIEALACGKPIVASAVGGFPEIVEHNVNGLLVPPKSVLALAKAIKRLMEDAGLKQKFQRNSVLKSQRFSHKMIIKDFISLYEMVLGVNQAK